MPRNVFPIVVTSNRKSRNSLGKWISLSAVILTLLAVVSCGGGTGGGSTLTTGTGGAYGSMPDAERASIMDQAGAVIQSLPVEQGLNDPNAMLAALTPIKGLTNLKISDDGGVIGTFSDSVPVVFVNNMPTSMGAPLGASKGQTVFKSHASISRNLPGTASIKILDSGDPFVTKDKTFDDADSFNSYGYPGTMRQVATIEALRALGGTKMGCLYITTHGGECYDPRTGVKLPGYALFTGTSANYHPGPDYNAGSYQGDVVDGSLAVMFAPTSFDANNKKVSTWHFGILSNFPFKYHWAFAKNSLVSLGACSSQSPEAAYFRQTLTTLGASLIAGWSTAVPGANSWYNNSYLFDRLLGANSFHASSGPPRRSFSVKEIIAALSRQNLITVPNLVVFGLHFGPTTWTFTPAPSPNVCDIFKPSLEYVGLRQSPNSLAITLILTGDFGADTGNVFINGAKQAVSSWTPSTITIAMSSGSPAPAGDIYVQTTRRDDGSTVNSNIRQISKWVGTASATTANPAEGKVTYNVSLSQDIGPYYATPDGSLQTSTAAVSGVDHGTAQFFSTVVNPGATCMVSGGGTFTDDGQVQHVIKYNGPSTLPFTGTSQTHICGLTLYAPISAPGVGRLSFQAKDLQCETDTQTFPNGNTQTETYDLEFAPVRKVGGTSYTDLVTSFDSQFNMKSGTWTNTTFDNESINWSNFSCTSPPSQTGPF